MAIDTSIYGQIQQPQIQDPLNALAKVSQVRALQNQNRLADLQFSTAEREQASQNALADAFRNSTNADGTIDRTKLYGSLATGGQGAKIPALQKQFTDADTAAIAQQKAKLESIGKQLEIVGQYMTAAKQNPAMYPHIVAQLRELIPGGGKELPDQYDPNIVDATISRAMSVKDQIAARQKDLDYQLEQQKFGYQQQNDAANRGVTIRGQNLTDARARETIQQGKIPAGYRSNGDGTVSPIPGGPADLKAGGIPKLTEDQGKATGWLVQASNAFDNMKAAIANDPGAAKPGVADAIASVPGLGAVGNHLRSPNRQKFNQASSSLSESLLRAATGAGVNKDEAIQKVQELTPVFGDWPEVIDQKMRAIPLYIESLKVRSGPGAGLAAGVMQTKGASKPSGGIVDFESLK